MDYEYTPPTPEQIAKQDRQNALYSAQIFLKRENTTAEEVVEFTKRLVHYLQTGD